MPTRPNSIYCHKNNYDILGSSQDSLEVILYSGDEDNSPQHDSQPQQLNSDSFLCNPALDSDFANIEEEGMGGEEEGGGIFQMDDIRNDLPSTVASLSSSSSVNSSDDSTSTAKEPVSHSTPCQHEPLDMPSSPLQVRYYVPTNEEPQGLSQSVITTSVNHNYIKEYLALAKRRQRLNLVDSSSCDTDEDENDLYLLNSEEAVVSTILNSEDTSKCIAPFSSSWSMNSTYMYSQSAPTALNLMDKMSFKDAFKTATSNAVSLQPSSSSENQVIGDHDMHSSSSGSSIDTVRPLSDKPEVKAKQESGCLPHPPELSQVEYQDNVSHGDHTEHVELKNKIHLSKENTHDPNKGVKEDCSENWCILADQRYGTHPSLKLQGQILQESRWDIIHQQSKSLEKLKHNGFVFELLNRYACPLKVSNLPFMTKYKSLQNHFFDPSVLYIRYIRSERCAYVVYRNYTAMMRGYHTLNLTVLDGDIIECVPSTMEELRCYLDREEQRKLSFRNQYSKVARSNSRVNSTNNTEGEENRNSTAVTKYHRDTFIPGRYCVFQTRNNTRNKRTNYHFNYGFYSQGSYYDYNMTGENPYYTSYDYNPLGSYYVTFSHPHQGNSSVVPTTHKHSLTPFKIREKKKVRHHLPEKVLQLPVVPVQYIIMKLNTNHDYSLSERIQYYPISSKKCAEVLNYVFEISQQVIFLLSIKGSSAFQSYATMSSEIMDLNELSPSDIKGTSFETLGTNFKTGKGCHKTCWRYVCRVEWSATRVLPMRQIGHCINAWNNNRLIKYSKDVTFVDPAVGKTMVDFMSASSQE